MKMTTKTVGLLTVVGEGGKVQAGTCLAVKTGGKKTKQ